MNKKISILKIDLNCDNCGKENDLVWNIECMDEVKNYNVLLCMNCSNIILVKENIEIEKISKHNN